MFARSIACLLLCCLAAERVAAAPPPAPDRLDRMSREGTSEGVVVPLFGQMLLYSLPDEFRSAPARTSRARIVQFAYPLRETPERWTQRIAIVADEALAFSTRTFPQKMLGDFVDHMRGRCPDSFGSVPLPGLYIGSYDTVVAVAGCGAVAGGGGSETTMQLIVKGGMDVYTIEWTVRGPATRGSLRIDTNQWIDRLKRLAPLRVCGRVAGEGAPYPSCMAAPRR